MTARRRELIKGTVTVGAASFFGSPLGAAPGHTPTVLPDAWDETADVIVVGSGFAGLAAAIEARTAGAHTIVLEKMAAPGGNSVINGGIMTAVGSPQQRRRGIADSPECLANDMLRAGRRMSRPDKVRLVADASEATYRWTVEALGVRWNERVLGHEGGHSVPRYVVTATGSGDAIVKKMLGKLDSLGVSLRLGTYVERIFRDADGRAVGLRIREGWQFGVPTSGMPKTIRATRAIVLCHGGFCADVTYRERLDPSLTKRWETTNQPGATSELWRETSRIGCAQVHNDWIQLIPWCSPHERGMGLAWRFSQAGAAEHGVWMSTSGKRFVNELADRKVRSDAILAQEAHGFRALAICNGSNLSAYRTAYPGELEKLVKRGIVREFAMLNEVATAYQMPTSLLRDTVDRFNEAVVAKRDPDFDRVFSDDQLPLTQGPWYVAEMTPKVHHCMGGLVTDLQCRVLDISTNLPIPGLYAAGEATSGVHGAVRLGACAMLDCLVNGRTAGREAAASARTVFGSIAGPFISSQSG